MNKLKLFITILLISLVIAIGACYLPWENWREVFL